MALLLHILQHYYCIYVAQRTVSVLAWGLCYPQHLFSAIFLAQPLYCAWPQSLYILAFKPNRTHNTHTHSQPYVSHSPKCCCLYICIIVLCDITSNFMYMRMCMHFNTHTHVRTHTMQSHSLHICIRVIGWLNCAYNYTCTWGVLAHNVPTCDLCAHVHTSHMCVFITATIGYVFLKG